MEKTTFFEIVEKIIIMNWNLIFCVFGFLSFFVGYKQKQADILGYIGIGLTNFFEGVD